MIEVVDIQILAIVTLVFLAFVAGHLLRTYGVTIFPESAAAVILGAIYAVIWYFIPAFKNSDADFSADSFFLVLLPIIIFESGYSVHRARLFANIGSILMFAVVGTMISAVVMAVVTFGLTRLNEDLTQYGVLDFLIFGAIMSATDPVATLAIFGRQNADPTLFSLVFGESVLNDAVAITFFKTLVSIKETLKHNGEFTAGAFFEAVGTFLLIGLGSTLLGVVLGAVNALILRRTLIKHHPPMEILFVISFAYATYVLSDGVGLSGIVAIFFFGICTRHYTYYNLSETSKTGSMWLFTFVWTFLPFKSLQTPYLNVFFINRAFKELAETTVFCFLGLSILQESKAYNVALIAISIFACLFARFCMVTPLSLLLNLKRKGNTKITFKMQAVIWNAGLRGAVAYALSLRLPEGPGRSLFVTTIHAVVIFTILVHGGLTGPLLNWTKLGGAAASSEGASYSQLNDSSLQPLQQPKKKKIHGFWSSLDKKYLIPFLSYPRNVYKKEAEDKEHANESELQDTSLLDEESNGNSGLANGADFGAASDDDSSSPPARSAEANSETGSFV